MREIKNLMFLVSEYLNRTSRRAANKSIGDSKKSNMLWIEMSRLGYFSLDALAIFDYRLNNFANT